MFSKLQLTVVLVLALAGCVADRPVADTEQADAAVEAADVGPPCAREIARFDGSEWCRLGGRVTSVAVPGRAARALIASGGVSGCFGESCGVFGFSAVDQPPFNVSLSMLDALDVDVGCDEGSASVRPNHFELVSIGDIDGDGWEEVGVPTGGTPVRGLVFSGADGRVLHTLDHDVEAAVPVATVTNQSSSSPHAHIAGVGDWDGDGSGDFAVSDFGIDQPGQLWVRSGATGDLMHHEWLDSASGKTIRLGGGVDIDGDGLQELLVTLVVLEAGRPAPRVEVRSAPGDTRTRTTRSRSTRAGPARSSRPSCPMPPADSCIWTRSTTSPVMAFRRWS